MSDQNFNPEQSQYVDPQQAYPQPGYPMPPQYAYPQPGYPMPPQYAYPQPGYPMPPQMAYGQPQYYAAPQPVYDAPAPTEEPEVILQESPFADFGFGEEDSVGSGHNFGGFMEDDNQVEEEPDEFNAFNSQTPNFDIAEVEAASKASVEDKAMFTSTTTILELSEVETASKKTDAEDIDIFSNSKAVGEREQTLSETPTFDAATASLDKQEPTIKVDFGNLKAAEPAPEVVEETADAPAPAAPSAFLASMASMMSSLNGTSAAPAVETPAPSAPAEPESPVFSQPDVVVSAASSQKIQDISSTSASGEKNDDYWKNIDRMLNNFDDGKHYQSFSEIKDIEETKEEEPKVEEPEVVEEPSFSLVAEEVMPLKLPEEAIKEKEEEEEEKAAKKAEIKAKREAEKAAKKENKAKAKAEKLAAKLSAKAEKRHEDVEENFGDALPQVPNAIDDEDVEEDDYIDKLRGIKGAISNVLPKKNDKVVGIVLKAVAIIAVLALLICGIYFIVISVGSNKNAKSNAELATMLETAEGSNLDWADIYTKYPNVNFPTGIQIKFAEIYAINNDLAGWITIDGLGIDYPVVQSTDNTYYLNNNFYKESSDFGTIFMNCGNSKGYELDLNTVLMGRAMRRDDQMFSRLLDYEDRQTFIDNPIIEFDTLYGEYKFKVYSVFVTNASKDDDNGYLFDYTFTNLSSEESFDGFIRELSQRELYHTGVDINSKDKIICLSTTSYEFDNACFVVVGRLLREGESEEIDTSKVTDNQSENGIRYPQAWYDAKGKSNPYERYAHWEPTT